jgi:hypothetical protein
MSRAGKREAEWHSTKPDVRARVGQFTHSAGSVDAGRAHNLANFSTDALGPPRIEGRFDSFDAL